MNDVSGQVVASAIAVHSAIGPGALESTYQACLAFELAERGLGVRSNVELPIVYKGVELDVGYRIDLLVEDAVVVELKAVSKLHPVHSAQLLSYLKLSGHRLGLLLNFHERHMRDGIQRFVNKL